MKKIYITLLLCCFIVLEAYSHESFASETKREVVVNGIGLGSIIAGITSWERNKSVLWVVIHAFLSWFYVVYFLLTRRKSERR